MDNLRFCVKGRSTPLRARRGSGRAALDEIRGWLGEVPEVGVIVAPNFSVGAVVGQRLAEDAAVLPRGGGHRAPRPQGRRAIRDRRGTARRIAAAEGLVRAQRGGEYRGGDVEGSGSTASGSRDWWRTRRSSSGPRDKP